MMRAHDSFRRRAAQVRRRYFSTRDDAVTVIADRALLRRYQLKRSAAVVIAGVTGGLGVGISLSHSGAIAVEPEIALGLPTAIGLAIALAFVYVPLPEFIRWLTLAAAATYFLLWKVDLTVELKLAAGVSGLAFSWIVAHLLQFGIGVAIKSARLLGMPIAVLALAALVAVTLVPPSSRAHAQSVAPCVPGELTVRVIDAGGVAQTVGDGERVDIEVPPGGTTLIVDAASTFDHGTVTIELIDTVPFPLPGSWFPGAGTDDRVVWMGHLGEGDAPLGRTGPIPIDIRRRSGDLTYSVLSPAHDASLHLVAGEGRYRARITDAASGATCSIVVRFRILASPVTTPVGIAGLAGAIVGLGLLTGALFAGNLPQSGAPRGRIPWRPLGRELTSVETERIADTYERPSFEIVQRERVGPDEHGEVWNITVNLQIEEAEHDVYEVHANEPRLLDLIDFNPVLVFPGADVPQMTIQVRTDPKRVDWRTAGLTLDVSSGGVGLTSQELLVFDGESTPNTMARSESGRPPTAGAGADPDTAVDADEPKTTPTRTAVTR